MKKVYKLICFFVQNVYICLVISFKCKSNINIMQILTMPKTRTEQLNDLGLREGFEIEKHKRASWANFISALHRDTDKQFSIRTDRDTGVLSVWRVK